MWLKKFEPNTFKNYQRLAQNFDEDEVIKEVFPLLLKPY